MSHMREAYLAIIALILLTAPGYAADSRLAQKVIYYGGYKRLHVVAEDLSRLTGVTIRCGQNESDWKVRDIPVVVCANDIPLGKLLNAIALTAHVQIRSENIGTQAEQTRNYRLCRDKKSQDEIYDLDAAGWEAKLKTLSWDWDMLVAFSKLPDQKLDLPGGEAYSGIDSQAIKLASGILAALGPDAKEKVFSYQSIEVKTKDSPNRALFSDLARYVYKRRNGKAADPTSEQISNSSLCIRLARHPAGRAELCFYMKGLADEPLIDETYSLNPDSLALMLSDAKDLHLGPRPKTHDDWNLEDTVPPPVPGMRTLESSKVPDALKRKVVIKFPGGKKPTRADVLTQLAKLTGLTIVSEDFVSHRNHWPEPDSARYGQVKMRRFGEKAAIWEVLMSPIELEGLETWRIDMDGKLLVHWQAGNWRLSYRNLVPASLIDDLVAKARTNGIELDDISPCFQLSQGQVEEWLVDRPDLPDLNLREELDPEGIDSALWRLYDSLGSQEKTLARSEAGLPLAKLDMTMLVEPFQRTKQMADISEFQGPQQNPTLDTLADPAQLAKLTVKVLSEPSAAGRVLNQHRYNIMVTDEKGGSLSGAEAVLPALFPIYTAEREAELRKKAQSSPAANEPVRH